MNRTPPDIAGSEVRVCVGCGDTGFIVFAVTRAGAREWDTSDMPDVSF
jgi:hypothetical protein